MIGMLGQELPPAQFSSAWPMIPWMYSKVLSSLNVIVKLTSAAIGKGSIGGTPPARIQFKIYTVNEVNIMNSEMLLIDNKPD
jgi:hypothetical protein